jgi:hypothetical protein
MTVEMREQIVEVARSWIGVPYLFLGGTREGIDCCHFVLRIGQEVGLIDPDFTLPLYNSPRMELFKEIMPQFFEDKAGEPEPGDIVLVSREPKREGWTPPPRHMFIFAHIAPRWGIARHDSVIGVSEGALTGAYRTGRPQVCEEVFNSEIRARHISTHIWKGLVADTRG